MESLRKKGEVLPDDVTSSLLSFDSALETIERELSPLLAIDLHGEASTLTPLEHAKIRVVLGYAINSLFYMYLKSQGVNPLEHPVKKELDRIKECLQKLSAVSKKMNQEGLIQSSPIIIEERKSAINKDVAKRLVNHALAGNDATMEDGGRHGEIVDHNPLKGGKVDKKKRKGDGLAASKNKGEPPSKKVKGS